MTEQSILNILLREKSVKTSDNHDINRLLVPELAHKVSSTLTQNLTAISNNGSHCKDTLSFIHGLWTRDETHHRVDANNKSIILDYSSKSFDEDETSKMIKTCTRELKMASRKFSDDRMKYAKEIKHNYYSVWESVEADLKRLEHSSGLEFNHPVCPRIFCLEKVDSRKDEAENNPNIIHGLQEVDLRLKHINFGYALLNVGTETEILTHLTILFNSLSEFEELHSYEKSFCKYLFKFIGCKPYILDFFREKLFFVLEIQIIDMCTVLIKGNDQDFKNNLKAYLMSEELQNTILACKLDHSINLMIKNMLYTLYCYSRFNTRILKFQSAINYAVG